MKTGDYVTNTKLVSDGYTFYTYFGYCEVWKDADNFYFWNPTTKIIESICKITDP